MEKIYKSNKLAIVGSEIKCVVCNKKFKKKTKQQVFCGGRGDTKCKDKYWNTVDPKKRNNKTRISPASMSFLESRRSKEYYIDDYEHPFSCEGLGQWND